MPEASHFERLGLPGRFSLDEAALEAAYLARSRELHPDLFGDASGLEQQASLGMSSRLNEAYQVLRDPWRQADYLLTLEGGPSPAEQKQMPPEFLEEMLELRMAIADLEEGESPERASMAEALSLRKSAFISQVGGMFDGLAKAPDRARALQGVRQVLNAWKFIEGLLRDLAA